MQQQDPKVWKVIDIINWGKDYLQNKNISEARLNIELLLCKVIKSKRFDLYVNFDKPLSAEELSELKALIKRRLDFEPLQYILGETEFMGLPFKIDKRALIPRPETERLVEECINACKNLFKDLEKTSILDIGTGSGNIAISLAKFLQNSLVTAIDASEDALILAKENAELNLVQDRIKFDLIDILKSNISAEESYNLIVSNPPYVQISEFESLQKEIKDHEPDIAVTDFSDGFTFYKRISDISKYHLTVSGILAFEIAYNQGETVKSIMEKENFKNIRIIKDYAGLDRIVIGNKTG
jgi:release factor glutamine methyltransferase